MDQEEIQLHKCSYGCGQKAKYYFKTVDRWCCENSTNKCPALKKRFSEFRKTWKHPKETKERISESNKNKKFSQERKDKIKIGQKLKPLNNTNNLLCRCGRTAKYQTKNGNFYCEEYVAKCPLIKQKNKRNNIGKKHSEETKKKMTGKNNPMYGKHHTPEVIQKMKELRNDPESVYQSKEYKKKLSLTKKRKFLDPVFLNNWRKSFDIKPNKPEMLILNILNKLFSGWEYVGDFKLWINGKNPDFVNRKKKKLIEHFGDFWHGEEFTGIDNETHEKERIEHFKKHGYETLIIWESELYNVEQLINKLINFNKRNLVQLSGGTNH